MTKNVAKDKLAANINWFPTLAERCGIAGNEKDIDGKSRCSVLNGKEERDRHETFYWKS